MYEYQGTVTNVVDGDTLDLDIDLGLRTHVQARVRLLGINAPEHGTPTGDLATTFVRTWVTNHPGPYTVQTKKDTTEKYGRWLARITTGTDDLALDLLNAGLASPWDGHGPKPVPSPRQPPP